MTNRLSPGDRVEIRVSQFIIVKPYDSYDEILTLEIVATDGEGCYLFVPVYNNVKGTVLADSSRCKRYHISHKFLNENIIYIDESMIYRISSYLDGINCTVCKEFFPMAASNQEDGSMICYTCRLNPYH